jgi:hypothetical protein
VRLLKHARRLPHTLEGCLNAGRLLGVGVCVGLNQVTVLCKCVRMFMTVRLSMCVRVRVSYKQLATIAAYTVPSPVFWPLTLDVFALSSHTLHSPSLLDPSLPCIWLAPHRMANDESHPLLDAGARHTANHPCGCWRMAHGCWRSSRRGDGHIKHEFGVAARVGNTSISIRMVFH